MQGTSHTHVGRTSLMVPTKPVKQRSVAPFVTSVDYLGSICYSSLLLNLWWETYSHFQMMLLQRMQTLLHIKCRQSTENVTLMGTRSCIHTYMHGIIVFVPKPIKVIFQTICYFGLSALLLASISMANWETDCVSWTISKKGTHCLDDKSSWETQVNGWKCQVDARWRRSKLLKMTCLLSGHRKQSCWACHIDCQGSKAQNCSTVRTRTDSEKDEAWLVKDEAIPRTNKKMQYGFPWAIY